MRNRKILIVEDHPDCRALLAIVLTRSGYSVVQAGTGLETLERASATNPDLIVMDFGLPDIDGDKVIVRLKADPSTSRIPVIVTTGHVTREITSRAISAGAATVLIKPYDIDVLMNEVARRLSSGPDPQPLSLQTSDASEPLNAD